MAASLLSYDEAVARILRAVPEELSQRVENVPLHEARGRVLVQTIVAGEAVPPFDNSSVDGFAVRLADTETATQNVPVSLRVTQTVAAGIADSQTVEPGEAARIFTGAPIPPGANSVIMVEDSQAEKNGDGEETVRLFAPASETFIRRAGSDIAPGQTALPAGHVLHAGTIGLLAALSFENVPCVARPRVGLITTGDEVALTEEGGPYPLKPGQIRNANGPALRAAIEEAGAIVATQCHARDTPADVNAAFDLCQTARCDVIIASGGVSVGDRDFVKSVVETRGSLDFWRVAVKPGKPLAFGKVGDALFWGLPGNPVSSLVTFELFARPALRKMGGFADVSRQTVPARLTEAVPHDPGRREFIRAHVVWQPETQTYAATPTGAQGSHRLMSLAHANALLVAHEDRGDYGAGETLSALLL